LTTPPLHLDDTELQHAVEGFEGPVALTRRHLVVPPSRANTVRTRGCRSGSSRDIPVSYQTCMESGFQCPSVSYADRAPSLVMKGSRFESGRRLSRICRSFELRTQHAARVERRACEHRATTATRVGSSSWYGVELRRAMDAMSRTVPGRNCAARSQRQKTHGAALPCHDDAVGLTARRRQRSRPARYCTGRNGCVP
jgi:hypothetical protein